MNDEQVDPEIADEARALAEVITFEDDTVLEVLQDAIRHEYLSAESERNGGAFATLDDTATAIWDEAVRISFAQWLNNRDPLIDAQLDAEGWRHEVAALKVVAEKAEAVTKTGAGSFDRARTMTALHAAVREWRAEQ